MDFVFILGILLQESNKRKMVIDNFSVETSSHLDSQSITMLCILAMACDFQQCGILTSVGSGEPLLSLEAPNGVQSVA